MSSRRISSHVTHRIIVSLAVSILATPTLALGQAPADAPPERVVLQPTPLASTTTFRAEVDRPVITPGEIELQLRSFEQSYRTGRVLLLVGGAVAAGMLADYVVRGDDFGMTGGSAAGYMTAMGLAGYGGYRMNVSRARLAKAIATTGPN
jgi:hypothetical protein